MAEFNGTGPKYPDTYGFPPSALDWTQLPDVDTEFISSQDLEAFARALQAPDPLQTPGPADEYDDPLQSPTPSLAPPSRSGTRDRDDVSRSQAVAASAAVAAGSFASPTGDYMGVDGGMPPSPALSTTASRRISRDMFFVARNDWAPVHAKVVKPASAAAQPATSSWRRGTLRRKKRAGKAAAALLGQRSKDETREGYLYAMLKWPLLVFCLAWLGCLAIGYALTRSYIFLYEHFFVWRGRREQLRKNMTQTSSYDDWVAAARELDGYLGRQAWKQDKNFAYYDSRTVKTVWDQMRRVRRRILEAEAGSGQRAEELGRSAVDEMRALLEACVKSNFVGIESARLYSQTYYGTKDLVQNFIDERELS